VKQGEHTVTHGHAPRVAVLRAADRAGALASALSAAGAVPVLCPLIDHELPAGSELATARTALQRLASGAYAWVVFTSVTAVRAAVELSASADPDSADLDGADPTSAVLDIAQGTRVAAVGQATARAVRALGAGVDLVPGGEHSARGLVAEFPAVIDTGAATVLLPAADLAAPTLADGLVERGWRPERVSVYRTVDAPADPSRALSVPVPGALPVPSGAQRLEPSALAEQLAAGALDAAVLTSPSTARRVVDLLAGRPSRTGYLALGPRTAAEATDLGLDVIATAPSTDPSGLAAALAAATERTS